MSDELDENTVELLKRSVEQQGELLPVIKDQDGNILSGRHRKAANPKWRETTIMVTDELDRLLKIIHFNVQRRPSQEETARRLLQIAEILESRGVVKSEIVQNIIKLVPYSERYVGMLLPSEYKRKYEKKEIAEPVVPQTASTTQDMPPRPPAAQHPVKCDLCPIGTGTWFPYRLKDGRTLCPVCFKYLWDNGEVTEADLLKEDEVPTVQIPKEKKPTTEVKEYKPPKETAEFRRALMHPGVSKMDEAVYLALQQNETLRQAGWHFTFQKRYCIKEVVNDVTAEKGDVEKPLFLDGEVHVGREERDEANRDLLARRLKIPKVLAFTYKGAYSDVKRDEIVAKIVEALK